MSLDARQPDGGEVRPAFERASMYRQFVLSGACALSESDDRVTLVAIKEYLDEREGSNTRSLQRAVEWLVENELLERVPTADSGDPRTDGRIGFDEELIVPESAWDEITDSLLNWSLGVGGYFEAGRWEFAETPRVEINYEGDDLDGQLETPITPTTITGMSWRRRLVLGALRVREVQRAADDDRPISVAAIRGQVGESVIRKRATQIALADFADKGLAERVATEGECRRYRTTLAGRAAFALFLRCWWNVVPDDRQPTSGAAHGNGGDR